MTSQSYASFAAGRRADFFDGAGWRIVPDVAAGEVARASVRRIAKLTSAVSK